MRVVSLFPSRTGFSFETLLYSVFGSLNLYSMAFSPFFPYGPSCLVGYVPRSSEDYSLLPSCLSFLLSEEPFLLRLLHFPFFELCLAFVPNYD